MSANQIAREARYIYADVSGNNNKYWTIQELANASCYINWGRVGANGQTQTKSFSSQQAATCFFDSKCREKESKGYEKLKVLAGQGALSVTAPGAQLAEIAAKQIETDSPQTVELVKRLAAANVHNILAVTTLTYDTSRGTFSTPLGIVTQEAIDTARALLTRMSKFIGKQDFQNSEYISLLNQYLRLVPQKVGRKLDAATLYPDLTAAQGQQDILDSLEASLKLAVNEPKPANKKVALPKLFEAKLALIESGASLKFIKKAFRNDFTVG